MSVSTNIKIFCAARNPNLYPDIAKTRPTPNARNAALPIHLTIRWPRHRPNHTPPRHHSTAQHTSPSTDAKTPHASPPGHVTLQVDQIRGPPHQPTTSSITTHHAARPSHRHFSRSDDRPWRRAQPNPAKHRSPLLPASNTNRSAHTPITWQTIPHTRHTNFSTPHSSTMVSSHRKFHLFGSADIGNLDYKYYFFGSKRPIKGSDLRKLDQEHPLHTEIIIFHAGPMDYPAIQTKNPITILTGPYAIAFLRSLPIKTRSLTNHAAQLALILYCDEATNQLLPRIPRKLVLCNRTRFPHRPKPKPKWTPISSNEYWCSFLQHQNITVIHTTRQSPLIRDYLYPPL